MIIDIKEYKIRINENLPAGPREPGPYLGDFYLLHPNPNPYEINFTIKEEIGVCIANVEGISKVRFD